LIPCLRTERCWRLHVAHTPVLTTANPVAAAGWRGGVAVCRAGACAATRVSRRSTVSVVASREAALLRHKVVQERHMLVHNYNASVPFFPKVSCGAQGCAHDGVAPCTLASWGACTAVGQPAAARSHPPPVPPPP
jgi:hypothetical protein